MCGVDGGEQESWSGDEVLQQTMLAVSPYNVHRLLADDLARQPSMYSYTYYAFDVSTWRPDSKDCGRVADAFATIGCVRSGISNVPMPLPQGKVWAFVVM